MSAITLFDDPGRDLVIALLAANNLPTADLTTDSAARFFAAGAPGHLHGIVAIEVYGRDGLIRSLAVAADHRGTGIGQALLRHAEERAGAAGVGTLYLLTETAARFFARHGYRAAERAGVPAVIAATPEFAGLCPDNASCMSKTL